MKFLFIIGFFLSTLLADTPIDITNENTEVLRACSIYLDKHDSPLQFITQHAQFYEHDEPHLNFGFVRHQTLWLRCQFTNPTNTQVTRVLELTNPLLEHVHLYDGNNTQSYNSFMHTAAKYSFNPNFFITLQPHELKQYYLKVQNSTTALRFGLLLQTQDNFFTASLSQKAIVFFFFGLLTTLMLYSFVIFLYTKDISYLYYDFYLIALILQQATYLGVSQLFLPTWLLYYDNISVILKVNLLYITAAIFAKSFLHTKNYPKIDTLYNLIIIVAIVEIPLFSYRSFYLPEAAILTGLVFVVYNIFAGYFIYRHGRKEARFFILGWSFLVVGYTLMILDGLGLISVMQNFPNLIIYLTAIEAMLLSLAFTDRYIILKQSKEHTDQKLLQTLQKQNEIIETEITKKTYSLDKALKKEKILLKELNHRTKNNLQLILSLIRMQKTSSHSLEGRIRAMAKTYDLLYIQNDLQKIDMRHYLQELCFDLRVAAQKDIEITTDIYPLTMILQDAISLGLIVNELLQNSLKHVTKEHLRIDIKLLKQNDTYLLEYKDNGNILLQGTAKKGLGKTLIHTIATEQLNAKFETTKYCYHYKIRFVLC